MAVLKILVLFVVFQIVNSRSLLKEIHMKKNFEFSIKPPLFPFKPITFIKQKWLQIGHAIKKRSPFELAPNPEGTIHNRDSLVEVSLEKEFGPGIPLLSPPPPPPPEGIQPPLFIPEKGPEISTPAPASVPPPFVSSTVLVPEDLLSRLPLEGGPEVIVITPVPPPPPAPVVSVPAVVLPPPAPGPPPPEAPKGLVQGNLLTDIARVDDINAYLKAVEALAVSPPPALLVPPPEGPPPPPPIEAVLPVLSSNSIEVEVPKPPPPPIEKTSPLVKGSRLALYFGNILLQVMSEVISSARSALSQYSPPAPI